MMLQSQLQGIVRLLPRNLLGIKSISVISPAVSTPSSKPSITCPVARIPRCIAWLKRRGSKVAQKVNVIGCNQKTLADAESGLSGSKLFSSQTRALSMLLIEPSTEREASQTDSVQIFEVQIQPHFWRGWYLKEKFKSIGKLHHLWSWNDSCNWYANEVQICERGRLSFAWVPSLKANDTRLQFIDLSKAKECDFMNESYMKTSNSKHWINQETTAVCLRWAYSSSRWPTDRHHCASKGTKQTSNSSHSCCTSARPGRCSSRRVQILGQEWQGTVTQRWETQNQNHCGFNWLNTNGQEAGRPAGDVQDHRHCPWLLLKLNLTDLIAWYCWENREAQSLLQTNCQTNSNYCLKWYRAAPGYKLHHLQPSRTSWPQDYRPGRKSRSESCENWTSASLPHLLLSNIGLTHIWHRNLIDGTHIPQTSRTMSLLTQCQIPLSVPSTADWVQRDLDATSVFSWHLWPGWSSYDNIQFQSLKFKTPLMLSICLFLLLQEQQHCNPHAFIMVLDDVWEQNWFETKTQKILSAEFEKATSPGRRSIQFDWRDCRLHHGRHLEIKMLVHEPELKVFKLWKKIKINSK